MGHVAHTREIQLRGEIGFLRNTQKNCIQAANACQRQRNAPLHAPSSLGRIRRVTDVRYGPRRTQLLRR